MAECSVDGCARQPHGHGFCLKHYKRWRNHGDPLAGRTPVGEPQRYFQEVVLPYEGNDCLTWPYSRTSYGYGTVYQDGEMKYVHNLICEAESGPRPTPSHEGAHGCGQGHNGCVAKRHIRWATSAENKADMVIHGTDNRGERCGTSKLTTDQVVEIRRSTTPNADLAKKFGVRTDAVRRARKGQTWGHIDV